MSKLFYERLKKYYEDVAAVLKGQAEVAKIFPNSSDIGSSREKVYAKFLEQHSPSKCNINLGGFLFGSDGSESSQLDIIINNDTSPRFDFYSEDKSGKSFVPVDGCFAVASIKSKLDKKEFINALEGLSTIPDKMYLKKDQIDPNLKYENYNDWPYKIIYANDGLKFETIQKHYISFYKENPIPFNKRPNIIHVAGKYAIIRCRKGDWVGGSREYFKINSEDHIVVELQDPDMIAIMTVVLELQHMTSVSNHIMLSYEYIVHALNQVSPLKNSNLNVNSKTDENKIQ